MRTVFVALITLAAIGAFLSRDDEVVSWSMLGPTVVAFWFWALSPRYAALPAYILGLTVPLALNLVESDAEVSMFISVVTATIIAAYATVRVLVRYALITFMFVMCTLGIVQAIHDFAWPTWLLGTCFAWVLGEALWRFSTTVSELEHTRSLVADQATLQERRRIARDVHDLVGHSLTVVLLHVTGARHLVHTDPDEAERALEQAEAAGRESLAEIRRTVGLLRDETDFGAPAVPSADLSDLRDLVNDFAAAGLDAHLEATGDLDVVDPTVALAGYRIAQEALTNASRHTIGAEVLVSATIDTDSCEITVANRGGETIDLGRGTGFGLVSMRERAKSVGGSLVAGPTRDGWTVEASLPIQPSRRTASPQVPASAPTTPVAAAATNGIDWGWQELEKYLKPFLPSSYFPLRERVQQQDTQQQDTPPVGDSGREHLPR